VKINIETIILCANVFLLTLAIGINIDSLYKRLQTPPEREYCSA
jgi:hypothetical protein